MKQAVMTYGSKQVPVAIEEVDGGLIIHQAGRELFRLQSAVETRSATIFERITVQDLQGESADRQRAMTYLRFKDSPALSDAEGFIFSGYEKYLPSLQDSSDPAELYGQDLQALIPHMSKLIANGQLVRGWQSRIAETLNFPNTGGSYRRRIFDAGTSLLKIYFSTAEKKAVARQGL